MSRILRRPMFRGGGKVSSYGNGIATGLASGGRVNLRVGGNPAALVNLGSGAGAPTQSVVNTGGNILTRNINKLKNLGTGNIESRLGQGIKSLYNLLPEEGLLSKGSRFLTSQFPKGLKFGTGLAALSGPGVIMEANRPKTYAALQYMKDMNQSGVFDETSLDYPEFTTEFDKLNDPNKYSAIPDDRGFINKYLNPIGAIVGLGDKSKEEIELIVDKDKKNIQSAENEAAAASGKEVNVNIETGNVTEPVLTKKERLDKAAKEYEEILGAGIKRDSIFDAMIEGGTRLYEGEGAGAAIRAANKALDPIQNIKTASRKLAVEEDIAIRKALAVAKGKSNATRDLIEQYKKAGLNDREIANRLSNNEVELEVIVQKMGSKPEGYKEFVRKKYPGVNILQETDPKKIDTSVLDDGRHYITYPTDAFIEVKDGKLVGKIDYR